MTNKIGLLLLASAALAGCQTQRGTDLPARGISSVNVPVVSRSDYVFDAVAPSGGLDAGETARLDVWFRGMELGYGDTIYLDGPTASSARADVARVAGQYGLLVSDGAPVTQGAVPPGSVRIVVSRTRASVPGCPNWSRPSQPNFTNETMSNFGCAVNGNLAAMIADPNDFVSGREGGMADPATGARAVQSYRSQAPTGEKGLQAVTTKGGN